MSALGALRTAYKLIFGILLDSALYEHRLKTLFKF